MSSEEIRKPEKFILDATAGFRMMWFNKHHPNCIYLDQRPECEPDIVGDFRDLRQFPDETFRLVVFDPPHHLKPLVRTGRKDRIDRFNKCYGSPLKPETWHHDIRKGVNESLRVLKPYGILIFKWTVIHIKVSSVLEILPIKPLFGYRLKGHSASKKPQTYWFCFMKIPEETKS